MPNGGPRDRTRSLKPPPTRLLFFYFLAIAAVHAGLAGLLNSRAGYALLAEHWSITYSYKAAQWVALLYGLTVAWCLLVGWLYVRRAESG